MILTKFHDFTISTKFHSIYRTLSVLVSHWKISINYQRFRFWPALICTDPTILFKIDVPQIQMYKTLNAWDFIVFRAFIAADVDLDGKIGLAEFDTMIESAASLPRKFGYNWWVFQNWTEVNLGSDLWGPENLLVWLWWRRTRYTSSFLNHKIPEKYLSN